MSRVHDALRKAEQAGIFTAAGPVAGIAAPDFRVLEALLEQVAVIPFTPEKEGHLIDAGHPEDSPTEEFRSLRTRLNHLQGMQPIHTVVVTSPSPAEGKSFTAANLAIVEGHLQGNNTLLCDFDVRRPVLHSLFGISRAPGITDYLLGKATLTEIIKKVEGMNLYVMPAGEPVLNPLELLNLREVKNLLDGLPSVFNWVILDSPPLLFAADANLLSTLCHSTLLVVRLGATTIEAVLRALQSMSHNNVIGVVVNGASRSELYSKYTYYHNYYYSDRRNKRRRGETAEEEDAAAEAEQSPAEVGQGEENAQA